jgi:hypothetical protein
VNFARFPAIRAVVFAIHAQADAILSLAVAAIPLALTLVFLLIALGTDNHDLHSVSFVLLPDLELAPVPTILWITIGQPGAGEQAASVTGSWLLNTPPRGRTGNNIR